LKSIWTEAALDDLSQQLEYVADDNPSAATRLETEIERQVDLLEQHPKIGRPGRVVGTRELVIARTPYVAIYRLRKNVVEILKLLHGAQEWPVRVR
jgi:toxin ParE1/3/4